MSFLAIKNKFSKRSIKVASFIILFFGLSTFAFAQILPADQTIGVDPTTPIEPGTPDTEVPTAGFQGTVQGFAWMGTGIQNQNASEGGGGWLKFNCAPEDCTNNWGATADMDPNSPRYGYFQGQAWSNNYGWLDFSSDNVSSCWEAHPSETLPDTAKILFPTGKVVGWAKFLAGDDFPDDGWDGCVSFSGVDYSVMVDLDTGVVSGWAWGSDVVGWVSFTNPECPFCNVTIVVTRIVGCMDPTATNYNPQANVPGRCSYGPPVRGCMDPLASNYNPLATIPSRCIYNNPVRGCTDPAATNYNPLATVDDGSCTYGPRRPTLDLQAAPNTLIVGSGNYITGLTWTSNLPSQLSSCVGTLSGTNIFDTGNQTNWDGSRSSPNVTTAFNVNLAPYAATAVSGNQYTFKLTCNISGGGTVSDTAVVNMIDPINPPTEPPLLWLHITNPNFDSAQSLLSEIIPPWSTQTSSGGAAVTLEWYALNVVPGSCRASSQMFANASATVIGTNGAWSGQTLNDNAVTNQTLDITNQSVVHNTKFQISCERLDQPGASVSAQVCMGIDGTTFPATACSAGNSINRPPGYKEI